MHVHSNSVCLYGVWSVCYIHRVDIYFKLYLLSDENYFRTFMVWLEDQKIRHYKIDDRAGLRNTTSSDWTKCLQQYLDDLGCPYQQSQRSYLIDWILGYATRLEYGDNGNSTQKFS